MSFAQPQTRASSPCISVCKIDDARDLCLGCGRTLQEIGAWGQMNEATRLAIMETLPARLDKLREDAHIDLSR